MSAQPTTATVQFETGVYSHLNGQTFKIVQVLANGFYTLQTGFVMVDFPAKNLILSYDKIAN
jgi:hypothetical protein